MPEAEARRSSASAGNVFDACWVPEDSVLEPDDVPQLAAAMVNAAMTSVERPNMEGAYQSSSGSMTRRLKPERCSCLNRRKSAPYFTQIAFREPRSLILGALSRKLLSTLSELGEQANPSNAQASQFRCPGCHADMRFDAATGSMACDFCGESVAFQEQDGTQEIVEYDLMKGLATAEQSGFGDEVRRSSRRTSSTSLASYAYKFAWRKVLSQRSLASSWALTERVCPWLNTMHRSLLPSERSHE